MEARSFTTSTNSLGEARQHPDISRTVTPSPAPSARILRLANYIQLVEADYLNDDLARTILATLNGPELFGLDANERAVLREPACKMARALCHWLTARPNVPIAEIIRAVPRLREFTSEDTWVGHDDGSAEVLDRYRAAKRGLRLSSETEEGDDRWSAAAKRAVLNKLVVDGLCEGEGIALGNLLTDVALIGGFFPFPIDPSELTSQMHKGGWYERLSPSDFESISQKLVALAPLLSVIAVQHILLFLNFRVTSSVSHNARVNEYIVAPVAQRCFALGLNEQAYTLVHWSLTFYAYRLSSEAAFSEWVDTFAAASAAAGRRLTVPAKCSQPVLSQPLQIAFITRGGSVSATAADHVLRIMKHIRRDHGKRVQCRLYVFDNFDEDLDSACASGGIDVRYVVDEGIGANRVMDKLFRLKHLLAEDGVHVALWTHAFDLVFFAFGMRLAPIQILFSQYLHPQPVGVDVDAYLTWGSPALVRQTFDGRPWRVVPSALRLDPSIVDSEEIRRLRSTYAKSGVVLVGTLARAEKVGQRHYLSAVVALLRRHSNVLFLWTGLTEHEEVSSFFEEAGVLGQTRFVGWVNVGHYVRVLDVVLDTFPLSNGITALEAMSCGTPVLSLDTPLSFIGRDIMPAFRSAASAGSRQAAFASRIRAVFENGQQDALPGARDLNEYIKKASRLVSDTDFRARCGTACKVIYRLIYADELLMTDIFVEQLLDIVAEQLPTRLGEGG